MNLFTPSESAIVAKDNGARGIESFLSTRKISSPVDKDKYLSMVTGYTLD